MKKMSLHVVCLMIGILFLSSGHSFAKHITPPPPSSGNPPPPPPPPPPPASAFLYVGVQNTTSDALTGSVYINPSESQSFSLAPMGSTAARFDNVTGTLTLAAGVFDSTTNGSVSCSKTVQVPSGFSGGINASVSISSVNSQLQCAVISGY